MKPVMYMALASVGTWIVWAAILGWNTGVEFFFGMLGPLAATMGTWLMAVWAYRQHPEQMTGLMAVGFLLKMMFFAAYVALMLKVVGFRPIPFVASFTGYFIGLYIMEALYLRRLFSERSR